jgi:UDPglucose 6-dehydrogenase
MRIAMVGVGYVGLVTAACLSDFGHEVACVDTDGAKVDALLRSEIPIFEPGLSEIVVNNLQAGRLSFTCDLAEAVRGAEAVFIAVGTPTHTGNDSADLSQVFEVASALAPLLNDYKVIVTKSTVPVGTGDEIEAIIARVAPEARFSVVANPEFLREGAAINDFKLPDRIVVGAEDEAARKVMSDIYRPLYLNQGPVMFTSRRTAELIKHSANAFLAMKVTFINEIAELCEQVGADVQEVARGIGLDNRIGGKFLNAGPGFGGSCFPKDMLALAQAARHAKAPLRLIETVIDVNEKRKVAMAQKIIRACGGSVKGATLAILGLTFKPRTDDMRSAPSLTILPILQRAGARVVAYDPKGMKHAGPLLPGVDFVDDPYRCIAGADAVVIITEWEAFRALDMKRVKESLRRPVVVDLRNIYRPDEMRALGFIYEGVGKGASRADRTRTLAAASPAVASLAGSKSGRSANTL